MDIIKTINTKLESAMLALAHSWLDNYSKLFKYGVILLGALLAGLVQTFPTLLQYEKEAYSLQYQIEAISKIDLAKTKCDGLGKESAKCKSAKYQYATNNQITSTYGAVLEIMRVFGYLLIGLGFLGYLAKEIFKVNLKTVNQSTKNIQVIDSAENCTYDIFEISDQDFKIIFPSPNQDIEFNTELFDRLSKNEAITFVEKLWLNKKNKREINGIHGTLFYDLDHKKKYYPTKQSSEMKIELI